MGNTTPESEPLGQSDAAKTVKETGEPLPGKLVEALTDIGTAMRRYSIFETDAQTVEAYEVAQVLQEKLVKAIETAQELPLEHRRGLLYTFSTLTLFINNLRNVVALRQESQNSSETVMVLKQQLVDTFKTHAEDYRQWLLQAIITKET